MNETDALLRQRIKDNPPPVGFKALLARTLRVSPSYVSHWLAGRRRFGDIDRAIAMRLLGVSEWELKEGR